MKRQPTNTLVYDARFDVTEKDLVRQNYYRLQAEAALHKISPPKPLKWYERLLK